MFDSFQHSLFWGREGGKGDLDVSLLEDKSAELGRQEGGRRAPVPASVRFAPTGATFGAALMGIKHSSRCMLLRRKMAESESGEVSARPLGTSLPSVRPSCIYGPGHVAFLGTTCEWMVLKMSRHVS